MTGAGGPAPGQAQDAGQEQSHRGVVGLDRDAQGQCPGEARASVSGDQAPVRICERVLPGIDQEHGAITHAVCIERSVGG